MECKYLSMNELMSSCNATGSAAQGPEGRETLRDAVGDGEYLLVVLPDGSRLVKPILQATFLEMPQDPGFGLGFRV